MEAVMKTRIYLKAIPFVIALITILPSLAHC